VMRANRYLPAFSLVLLVASAAAVGLAHAANYDGTYDLEYNYYTPDTGWVWITLEGGLIVSGGETSSPRAGYFVGYVNSDGYIWMQSPDPMAPSVTSTWDGYLESDGTGTGNWESDYDYGTWYVERVSGPIGDVGNVALAGGLMGLGGASVLYSMGYGTVKGKFMSKGSAVAARAPKWAGRVRSMGFWSGPPNPPPPVINQDNLTGVVTRGQPPFIGEPAPNQSPPGWLPPFIGQQGSGVQPGANLPPFIGMDGGGVAATAGGPRVGGGAAQPAVRAGGDEGVRHVQPVVPVLDWWRRRGVQGGAHVLQVLGAEPGGLPGAGLDAPPVVSEKGE